jgi:tuberculosinol/isotuberculosinol synthase
MAIIDYQTFLKLPTNQVASLVRTAGPQVCVFTINGTRRWFTAEHTNVKENSFKSYLDITGKRYIELYQLCIEHGLDTILAPVVRSESLTRGSEYVQTVIVDALAEFALNPEYLAFYQQHQVRVHFYGDYRKLFPGTPFAYLTELFDNITKQTQENTSCKLFYGIFASDASETIAELSVKHFQKTGNIPSRKELVEQYYGEPVDPVTLYINFDKSRVFDYPLLNLGDEDLYFTFAPTPYMDEEQLRSILYDHIYLRPVQEIDYSKMLEQDFQYMNDFYRTNRHTVSGIGEVHGGIWYPKSETSK